MVMICQCNDRKKYYYYYDRPLVLPRAVVVSAWIATANKISCAYNSQKHSRLKFDTYILSTYGRRPPSW